MFTLQAITYTTARMIIAYQIHFLRVLLLVTLVSGVTAIIQLIVGTLEISLGIPRNYTEPVYTTCGLFGNNDGNTTNDFMYLNGTYLSDTMTEREIFHYGEQCECELSLICVGF